MSECGDINTDIPRSVVPVVLVLDARDMSSRVLHCKKDNKIVGASHGDKRIYCKNIFDWDFEVIILPIGRLGQSIT